MATVASSRPASEASLGSSAQRASQQGGALGVVGLVLDYEQGDGERVLKVDGGELGGGRLDERQVAALKGLAEPSVVTALDRHEHRFAWSGGRFRNDNGAPLSKVLAKRRAAASSLKRALGSPTGSLSPAYRSPVRP